MACVVGIVEVFPKIGMVGHCVEVEGNATTTCERVYQTLHTLHPQKLIFRSIASIGNFHTHIFELEV